MIRLGVSDSPIVREPRYFEQFHCLAADCQDTCCAGWGVSVDRQTWEKYQDPALPLVAGRHLSDLIEIAPAGGSTQDYARVKMEAVRCTALQDGLCSIQLTLGESYLPALCSSYPRVLNVESGVMERSLHLSCPEAARLVLTDPDAMQFVDVRVVGQSVAQDAVARARAELPESSVRRARAHAIELLRDRSRPLWERVVSLGSMIEMLPAVGPVHAGAVVQRDPGEQLETVMELIVARLGADYTAPRFLECYREFMLGLEWTGESTMQELTARYEHAAAQYFLPFAKRHEHLLENYLVHYAFRTGFPYRRKHAGDAFELEYGIESLRNSYLLLAVHYANIRALMIGAAALHRGNLGMAHAIKIVQTYSRAFLHMSSFESIACDLMSAKPGEFLHKAAILVMD